MVPGVRPISYTMCWVKKDSLYGFKDRKRSMGQKEINKRKLRLRQFLKFKNYIRDSYSSMSSVCWLLQWIFFCFVFQIKIKNKLQDTTTREQLIKPSLCVTKLKFYTKTKRGQKNNIKRLGRIRFRKKYLLSLPLSVYSKVYFLTSDEKFNFSVLVVELQTYDVYRKISLSRIANDVFFALWY